MKSSRRAVRSMWTCFNCDEFYEDWMWEYPKARKWCVSHAEETGHETNLEQIVSTIFTPEKPHVPCPPS